MLGRPELHRPQATVLFEELSLKRQPRRRYSISPCDGKSCEQSLCGPPPQVRPTLSRRPVRLSFSLVQKNRASPPRETHRVARPSPRRFVPWRLPEPNAPRGRAGFRTALNPISCDLYDGQYCLFGASVRTARETPTPDRAGPGRPAGASRSRSHSTNSDRPRFRPAGRGRFFGVFSWGAA